MNTDEMKNDDDEIIATEDVYLDELKSNENDRHSKDKRKTSVWEAAIYVVLFLIGSAIVKAYLEGNETESKPKPIEKPVEESEVLKVLLQKEVVGFERYNVGDYSMLIPVSMIQGKFSSPRLCSGFMFSSLTATISVQYYFNDYSLQLEYIKENMIMPSEQLELYENYSSYAYGIIGKPFRSLRLFDIEEINGIRCIHSIVDFGDECSPQRAEKYFFFKPNKMCVVNMDYLISEADCWQPKFDTAIKGIRMNK